MLRLTDPLFELHRTQIAQTLMELAAIAEPFNQRKDFPARFLPRVVRLMMDQFIFQRGNKMYRESFQKASVS